MNKIYFALAFSAIFAACTTDDGPTQEDIKDSQSNFAKIEVVTGTLEDARDNKLYKTVQIKDQTWMAENLNYAAEGSFCPQGEEGNCDLLGRLYTWSVAMDSSETAPCGYKVACDLADSTTMPKVRGICPEGWHLPSDAEWDALIAATGDEDHAAKALKSKDVWTQDAGEDLYQFSVKPTGYRSTDGSFYQFDAHFWSSTEFVQTNANGKYSNNACGRFIDRDYSVKHRSFDKRMARSVRCIKD